MKKKVHLYCVHHMDLIWQRGWDRCHSDNGQLIRSYKDLEERQILRWLDLMNEHDGVKHSVEQTLSLRMFIDRNPDLRDTVRKHLKEGKLCADGGGESIIDTNLVCGESIVRNHLYSIHWLRKEFGYTPQTAIATDTFGLCAQLPQILRGFGYNVLALHSRVFDRGKLVWQGLDGSRVYIGKLFSEPGSSTLVGKWHAFCDGVSCRCGNRGCDACTGFGTVHSGLHRRDADKVRSLFSAVRETETEHVVVYLCSEWQIPSPRFMETINDLENECDCEVTFSLLTDLRDDLPTPGYDRFMEHKSENDDISPRPEGNPVCTGCYLSRIKLKQQNRELENRLIGAEIWAALASEIGCVYPREKLAHLWNRMALTQFHDAVTGPHTDLCYEDLLCAGTEIRGGACMIAEQATSLLAKHIRIDERPGMNAFAVFNPVNWETGSFPASVWIDWPFSPDTEGIELFDEKGNRLNVSEFAVYPEMARARIVFTGGVLPPVGYALFYFRPVQASPAAEIRTDNNKPEVLENGRYRIRLNQHGIGEVFDKQLDRTVCKGHTGGLILEEDYGSPWETLVKPYFSYDLNSASSGKPVLENGSGYRSAVYSGECDDPVLSRNRNVHRVVWEQRVTLYDQLPGIHIRTELTWDTENMRVSMQIPLAFRTPEDSAFYEIPFGIIRRTSYPPSYGIHTKPNGDWPCLNSVTCVNSEDGYTVTVCNRGLPCHRVEKGRILLGLARSPRIPVYISNFKSARDPGPHLFETVLFSEPGGLRESRAVQRGIEYNARLHAASCDNSEGTLPGSHSFLPYTADNIGISALKRAEDGDDMIVRAWEMYGEHTECGIEWPDNASVSAADLLECAAEQTDGSLCSFRPFEIKTFRVKGLQY